MRDNNNNYLPMHTCRVIEPTTTINRLQFLLHLCAASVVLYYHASCLLSAIHLDRISVASVSLAFVFLADVVLFFMWVLSQGFRYRPVSRSVFPERLPDDDMLPDLDIFIMTANPDKEPTIEVMNTVLSVMALDYPSEKLHIYLSDDAGADVTLHAVKEAYSFGRFWVPFCKRFAIGVRCPEVFFDDSKINQQESEKEFVQERQKIKVMYDAFQKKVKKLKEGKDSTRGFEKTRHEHPSKIENIREVETNSTDTGDFIIPSLVYVSREKRKGVPHHFKAGALNVLLRVSGVVSNSPYILVLDCDMYSNDPSSVRQAMCFHLDSKLSPFLAFVQFPQEFYNINKDDIYCAELRIFFKTLWLGLDGLRGPVLSGTNFFVKRCALYGNKPSGTSNREEFNLEDISRLKHKFGNSNEFCLSLVEKSSYDFDEKITTYINPQKDKVLMLASLEYESDTRWGDQIGFLYSSVVEDYFTGFHLHCRGWVSTYCFPSKPAFLGNVPINFNDTLFQNKRWNAGLFEVALSRHCPLIFGISKNFNSVLQSMCYAWLAFWPVFSFPLLCYGIFPQLCFLNGISLFPEITSPWFGAFAVVFLSSCIQHLREVVRSGRNFTTWCNEQRFWMINGLTGQLFAVFNVLLKLISISAVNFDLTNKTADKAQIERYENGVFDFEGCSLMLLPATTLSLVNLGALIGGAWQMIKFKAINRLFAQFGLSCFILALSLPLIEGIIFRQDTGRVPPRLAMWSIVLSGLILFMFMFG
ncbi:cellulose synthase family protein [Rhynchospora pubera]|uniref:Cellulose synthase family protein n=1 Tax=Rhynchospora pubera TaxID=906938 RepID=A0AAV8C038_9POAL|nr:cellulose synthase family protein [Rhynchospora pubera]